MDNVVVQADDNVWSTEGHTDDEKELALLYVVGTRSDWATAGKTVSGRHLADGASSQCAPMQGAQKQTWLDM